MCGIVGYWNRGGEAAGDGLITTMLERIRYRGPDDQGTWVQGPIGLGHCRLSILDISPRGHQPFVTADGQGILTYNGEVYNAPELRRRLEAEGVRFLSTSDTEVVLYALHRWGVEKAIPLFNGMFALAYVDRRTGTLWLVRDRVGIKPLYVARTAGLLAFASEMKALLAHPDVPCRPDLHTLTAIASCERLNGEWWPQEWCPFEGIEAVKPGTIWKVTPDTIDETTYFDIFDELDVDRLMAVVAKTPEELVGAFEQTFRQSVRIHLLSDAPLAAMCSGGVDSSLMTAYANDEHPNLVAYVADVKGAVSEGAKARAVGRHLGVEIRQVDVAQADYLRLWPTAVWHGDVPTFHEHDIPFLAVARACRRDGFKVVLTGEGADELFGGYPWHVKAYRMWRLRSLQGRLVPNIPPFRLLGRWIPMLSPSHPDQLLRHPFTHRAEMEESERLLRHACAVDGGQRLLRSEALFRQLQPVRPIEERAFLARALNDLYGYLQTLLRRNDRMGMAASLESRVPFLENRMMDMALHMPFRGKYHGGHTKWVVKTAAAKRLPGAIVHAPKLGFAVPRTIWRSSAPLLRDGMVAELLKWERRSTPLIIERAVQEPYVLLTLVGMELWARIFLRGESPEDLGEELLSLMKNEE